MILDYELSAIEPQLEQEQTQNPHPSSWGEDSKESELSA